MIVGGANGKIVRKNSTSEKVLNEKEEKKFNSFRLVSPLRHKNIAVFYGKSPVNDEKVHLSFLKLNRISLQGNMKLKTS